ncbi:adenylate cyclase type 10 [Caerostris darwini]|uniref:Adenylate cyclase type 10 n=1 Tax=Caerostris darwini TaxID=1538125 RepID=A0AAV4P8Y5_9ARAC|nr:adenylate cyclase type 10 [Caerostris darwini]
MPCCPDCGSWLRDCCKKKKDVKRDSITEAEETLEQLEQFEESKELTLEPRFLPLTFVPDIIIEEILNESFRTIPYQIRNQAVILIADVCGFTSLTESYCQKGTIGIEELARVLNGYMSTLAAMLLDAGGDILNFAGDAFLVYWKETDNAIIKAFMCAIALQTHTCLQEKNLDGTLKVKIGIGKGNAITWILGTPQDFLLFVMAGHGIAEAHQAEEMCNSGDIIVSKSIFTSLQAIGAETFAATELVDGFVKISGYGAGSSTEPYPERIKEFKLCAKEHITLSKFFLIPSLRDLETVEELSYVSELTMVTILFISLKDINVEEPQILDKTFDVILACAKLQGGVLNKMLLFDKGCTYLVVFGLQGQKHSDDAARGLLCANDIVNRHESIQLKASVGVASGTCFCGLVGHPQRQEYTVIGNRVNLAARIMVKYKEEPIVLDSTTYHLSRETLGDACFYQLPARKMKGIESAGNIYAYRIKSLKTVAQESSVDIPETMPQAEGEDAKGKLISSLKTLFDEQERQQILSTAILPVIIIEGPSNSGKSYYMYFAVHEAKQIGYKICCCCTVEDSPSDPFLTIALLVQRMLDMSPKESVLEREMKILKAFPLGFDPQLYLLNHFFHVQFRPPDHVNIDQQFIWKETCRLFKIIFQKFADGTPS